MNPINGDIRIEIGCDIADRFAFSVAKADLGRESEFMAERGLPEYPAALKNYSDALWAWVDSVTGKEINKKVNGFDLLKGKVFKNPLDFFAAHHDEQAAKLMYFLHRAVFFEGNANGQRREINHVRFALEIGPIVNVLNDEEFYRELLPRKYNKPIKPAIGRTMKFQILLLWLSGGMWKAESRKDQWAIVESAGWLKTNAHGNTIRNWERDLGLKWAQSDAAEGAPNSTA